MLIIFVSIAVTSRHDLLPVNGAENVLLEVFLTIHISRAASSAMGEGDGTVTDELSLLALEEVVPNLG